MEKRDFRISDIVRSDLKLSTPVFETDENISELYREALSIAYSYNQKEKEKGKSDFISASKLHATAVLHLLYQIVLTACMNAGHADFFLRRQSAINDNDDLKNALSFYSNHFPSPLLNDNKELNSFIRREEDSRAFFIHQVIQQLLSPFIRQADFMHPFLAWAGTVGKAAQRCVFRRPDSTVVEVCVIFQLNGGRQLINPDQRSCQCVSPIMPAMYHAEHQRIEGIIIRLFGCEVVASVFRVVNGVHLAPVALCIVPDLAYAVATCHDGIFQYRADIYCTGIYIYIIERAFDQSPPQF